MNTINDPSNNWMGSCGLLSLACILLKLTGCITWSWWWVLAPSLVAPAIVTAVCIVRLVRVLIKHLKRFKS